MTYPGKAKRRGARPAAAMNRAHQSISPVNATSPDRQNRGNIPTPRDAWANQCDVIRDMRHWPTGLLHSTVEVLTDEIKKLEEIERGRPTSRRYETAVEVRTAARQILAGRRQRFRAARIADSLVEVAGR